MPRLLDRFINAVRVDCDSPWIIDHVSSCPKCRGKMLGMGKVELALELAKTQKHHCDLLRRANRRALAALNHLPASPEKLEELRNAEPKVPLTQKLGQFNAAFVKVAACTVIAVLLRTSILRDSRNLNDFAHKAVKDAYSKQLGQELADDLFR